jgi:hypothetical protein
MRLFARAALLLLLPACTAHNSFYVPDGDEGAPTDLGRRDGAPPLDLSGPHDLAIGGPCVIGQRSCAGSFSEYCPNGMFAADRACPTGSMCAVGHCQPPLGAHPCDAVPGPQENQCVAVSDTLSCQPFVVKPNTATIGWSCTKAVGAGLPGVACTSGAQCRSGFCGSNGTCFRACANSADCPQATMGKPFSCSTVNIIVEGIPIKAGSCIN